MARPDWSREGLKWPHREASRFVAAAGLNWHAQIMGQGPDILLIHGAGSATHSWRDVAPRLARDFRVIAIDLPGHGFTSMPSNGGLSLPGMANALGQLLDVMALSPRVLVGHSAGAAVALRLSLDRRARATVVGINAALRPFAGAGLPLVSAMTRSLFLNPAAIAFLAWRASRPEAVRRLIAGTGSSIDATGLAAYGALFSTTGHVQATLGMMAHWDLRPLLNDLPLLASPLTLVVASGDLAVPPSVSCELRQTLPQARLAVMPGLGHLAHEEDPERAAALIAEAAEAS